MNVLFPIFGILMLIVGFLFVKELFKSPQRNPPPLPAQAPLPPPQQFFEQQPMDINTLRANTQQAGRIPRKDYRQAYSQLQREMQIEKEENRLSPQARTHLGKPREAFKTVDTDFEQAKTKMWGISPLKTPINPEEYDTKTDSLMFWNHKRPTIYGLLAIVSFILFLMLGV